MATKNSFVFYTEWLDIISRLAERGTAEDVVALCDGIKAFVESGEETEMPLAAEMVFCSIKNQISRDAAKYEKTSQKRKEAINKRWHGDTNECKDIQTDTKSYKSIQTDTNDTDNEDDYVDDYVSPNGDNKHSSISPLPKPQFVPESDPKKMTDKALEQEFDALWLLYPRKAGKADALRHYKAARRKGVTYEAVEDGIKRYANHVQGQDPQYIAMGSTWFNGHRWDDVYQVRHGPKPGSMEWLANIANGGGINDDPRGNSKNLYALQDNLA